MLALRQKFSRAFGVVAFSGFRIRLSVLVRIKKNMELFHVKQKPLGKNFMSGSDGFLLFLSGTALNRRPVFLRGSEFVFVYAEFSS